jgi:hypothetical protein
MVAFVVLLLLQVPPGVALVRVTLLPTIVEVAPMMLATGAFTDTVREIKQPGLCVYVTFAVPAVTPVIRPVVACTLATAAALLAHVPPDKPVVSVALVWPTHTWLSPEIVPPAVLTDTAFVVAQPAAFV